MTLGELASLIRTPVAQIITYFFAEKGKPMTINDVLEKELIEEVCNHYELEYIFDDEKTTTAGDRGFLAEQQEGDHLEPRPPVVTVTWLNGSPFRETGETWWWAVGKNYDIL